MQTHYNVLLCKGNGAVVRFVKQILKQSRGFQVERSFGRHRSRAFGKTNQAPIQRFNVRCLVFLYKLPSLRVERHITRKYPVSGSCVDENALLMSEVRGEWTDWLEMIERQH